VSGSRDVDLCSRYHCTSRTHESLSEVSGSSDVDLSCRYIWTSRTRRRQSEMSGSRDVDMCSWSVWTSHTQKSLAELSTCTDVGWARIWRKLTGVPYCLLDIRVAEGTGSYPHMCWG